MNAAKVRSTTAGVQERANFKRAITRQTHIRWWERAQNFDEQKTVHSVQSESGLKTALGQLGDMIHGREGKEGQTDLTGGRLASNLTAIQALRIET